MGVSQLKALEKQAQFKFVSLNLYSTKTKTPLFQTHYEFEKGGKSILITGISSGGFSNKDFEVRMAEGELSNLLKSLPKKDRIVVVLSSLSEDEERELVQKIPNIHILLNASPKVSRATEVEQWGGATIRLRPLNRSQSLAKLELPWVSNPQIFFNEGIAQNYRLAKLTWEKTIAGIDEELEQENTPERKSVLEKEKVIYTTLLREASLVPTEIKEGAVIYEAKDISLDDNFESPENPMTKLVEDYKKAIRALALDGKAN